MLLIKGVNYFLFILVFLFSNKLFFIRNAPALLNQFSILWFFKTSKFYTLQFYFTSDLWFRFAKTNLKYFRKLKKRHFFLPVLDNFHLTKNFLNYPGVKILVGSKKMLPMFISRSGVFSPFLSLRSKKSFWKSFYWSFLTLTNSFRHVLFFKINNSFLLKSNLLINLTVNLRLKVIQLVTGKIWHTIIQNSMVKKLFFVSKLYSNSLKVSPKILNYFLLTEFNYIADYWKQGPQENKKIFRITKFKKFQSVWDYKRPTFYVRHQREILKKIFFIKGKNYVINNFVQKLYKTKVSGFYALLRLELKINFSLIRSRFCTTSIESRDFISGGLVYINNNKCTNQEFILSLKDRISLSLHLSNFIYFRYAYSFLISKRYKLNIYSSMKSILRRNNRTPPQYFSGKWIYKNMFNNVKIPRYIEVDYTTLSYVVVFLPFSLRHIFPVYWKYFKFLNIRYYNWKYLY